MFPPRGFADLADQRVGIYGMGVEGHATLARLRLLTSAIVCVDDHPHEPGVLRTDEGGFEALADCSVVLKSPGIAPHAPVVVALRDRGVHLTSAMALWMHDAPSARTIAITGTKGKSTTTALVAFFFECVGDRAHRLGNIGQPPYDPTLELDEGWLVVELSSFQCADLDTAPPRIVLTALGVDHLDWHGSVEQYRRDKLAITRCAGARVIFAAASTQLLEARTEMGATVRYVEPDDADLAGALHLLGQHSRSNVALALAVVADATGLAEAAVRERVRARADAFEPLRGRLTFLGVHEGITFVDDGLATAALPTAAALEVFAQAPVSLIVGGFDRGVSYDDLTAALQERTLPTDVVALGPAGERMVTLFRAAGVAAQSVATMDEAVAVATRARQSGGVVLFSPAAPSFDAYQNWLERSTDFARAVAAQRG